MRCDHPRPKVGHVFKARRKRRRISQISLMSASGALCAPPPPEWPRQEFRPQRSARQRALRHLTDSRRPAIHGPVENDIINAAREFVESDLVRIPGPMIATNSSSEI